MKLYDVRPIFESLEVSFKRYVIGIQQKSRSYKTKKRRGK